MKYGLNEYIAKLIIDAQVASDGGKYIYSSLTENNKNGKTIYHNGYSQKDHCIQKAISEIQKSHGTSGFKYYISSSNDETAGIIYFEFKLFGDKYQISFHTFNKDLIEKYGNNKKTHWNKKSSYETAIMLQNIMQL